MRYEIKKILSCKILMISMIVAFIFSMAISYNAYANEKINLESFLHILVIFQNKNMM